MDPWTDLDRPPLRVLPLRRALTGDGGWAHGGWERLDVLTTTGSTNADLLARAGAPGGRTPHGTVLVADHQAAGRGRLGRGWEAPPRSALAVSVLLRPALPVDRWSWLPLLAGVAAVDALAGLGVRAGLKWPNDVLVTGPGRPGKVCGVLAEVRGDAVVLGAGINVSQREDELPVPATDAPVTPTPATSLALAGATSTDRDTVLRRYLRALRTRLDDYLTPGSTDGAAALADAYRGVSATLGQVVRAHLPDGSVLEGTAVDVDADGRLVVETSGGVGAGGAAGTTRTSLSAADVVHLRPVGP